MSETTDTLVQTLTLDGSQYSSSADKIIADALRMTKRIGEADEKMVAQFTDAMRRRDAVANQLAVKQLSAMGKHLDAELLAIKQNYAERIKLAQTTAEKETLIKLRALEYQASFEKAEELRRANAAKSKGKGSEIGAIQSGIGAIVGGASVLAAGAVGDSLANFAGKLVEIRNETFGIAGAWKDVAVRIGEGLPLLGGFVKAGQEIRELLTNEQAQIDLIKISASIANTLVDAQKERLLNMKAAAREAAVEITALEGRLRTVMARGPNAADTAPGVVSASQEARDSQVLADAQKKEAEIKAIRDRANAAIGRVGADRTAAMGKSTTTFGEKYDIAFDVGTQPENARAAADGRKRAIQDQSASAIKAIRDGSTAEIATVEKKYAKEEELKRTLHSQDRIDAVAQAQINDGIRAREESERNRMFPYAKAQAAASSASRMAEKGMIVNRQDDEAATERARRSHAEKKFGILSGEGAWNVENGQATTIAGKQAMAENDKELETNLIMIKRERDERMAMFDERLNVVKLQRAKKFDEAEEAQTKAAFARQKLRNAGDADILAKLNETEAETLAKAKEDKIKERGQRTAAIESGMTQDRLRLGKQNLAAELEGIRSSYKEKIANENDPAMKMALGGEMMHKASMAVTNEMRKPVTFSDMGSIWQTMQSKMYNQTGDPQVSILKEVAGLSKEANGLLAKIVEQRIESVAASFANN